MRYTNAINDALAPLGAGIETLPMAQDDLWRVIAAAPSQSFKTYLKKVPKIAVRRG